MNTKRATLWLLILEIGFPIMLLAALDAGFRWYRDQHDAELLPELFASPLTTGKYLQYRQRANVGAPLDVLLMGTSQMMRVNAGQLSERLSERCGRPITTFNFAAPNHSVELDRHILESIVLRLNPPRVVVYGIIPTNLLGETNAEETNVTIRAWPVFTVHGGTPAARLHLAVLDHLDLFLYREAIQRRLLSGDGKTADNWMRVARATDAFGDTPVPGRFTGNAKVLTPWERGFLPRFKNFDRLVDDTPLFANIERLASFCRERGIRLVLMSNDVNPLYLEMLPRGVEDYRRFINRVSATAAAARVPLFSPTAGGLGDPELFVDATHHNHTGMRWATAMLAEFLLQQKIIDVGLPPNP